jgi:predicted phosphoribosyltransferase
MARTIADALEGEADVVLVHKLRAPHQPELAIGAVDERGHVVLNEVAAALEVSDSYLNGEVQHQLAHLRAQRDRFTPVRAPIDPSGRVVVIVDDGVATGATMSAAVHAVRAQAPARVIAAMGVASSDAVWRLRHEADEVVSVFTPPVFRAVGEFFDDFSQVTDEEAIGALAPAEPAPARRGGIDIA